MNKNLQSVTLLYDALTLVRYPGIAQVDVTNFKSCFLNENNILSLLRWLYVKGLDKTNSTDKTLNHTQGHEDLAVNILSADEKFFTKWYFQSGIYTGEKVLQSQCQSDTFINLKDYIINVLYSEVEVSSELVAWTIVEQYFTNQVNFIPLSYNLNNSIRSDHLKLYIENLKNSNEVKDDVNEEFMKEGVKFFLNKTESSSIIIESENKNSQPFVILRFCKNFKNFESGISTKNFIKNKKTEDASLVGNKNIKFSGLNKVICAKTNFQYNLVSAYLKPQKSLLHLISENIMSQLNYLAKLRDV